MLSRLLNRVARTGYVPDTALRFGVRRLLRKRVQKIRSASIRQMEAVNKAMVAQMSQKPVTHLRDEAKRPQYELPPEFYRESLGERLSFTCAFWPQGVSTLKQAEQEALEVICRRAQLEDGLDILELGSRWGALSVYIAQQFPNSHVTSVADTQARADFIQAKAVSLQLTNLTVLHADITEFEPSERFARIVSVEMFEHVRYWQALFRKIARWLEDDGLFFMQIFAHKDTPYYFEENIQGAAWMTSEFLKKGLMPSLQLPLMFGDDLLVEQHWQVPGQYYEKTANAWLQNMDRNRQAARAHIKAAHGEQHMNLLWVRWRLLFMSKAELFGFEDGCEWLIGQYRFCRPDSM